ncbi:MAG: aldolase/citrate lyase family protein [Bacteroidales bacterium]|nr:citrate lyase subunit beta [Lentimicrobiaceae bacterium]MDD5694145.1 aldolase/citrate lyase family protein [Bacteroidales bacterium]
MTDTIAQVGNKGERVRSDCFVTLEITETGGLIIQPVSKVKTLYGQDIRNLAGKMLEYFGITHAHLTLDDSGALPFVLAARIEAAVKLLTHSDKEFLMELIPENLYQTQRDRQRISRLYLPGNTPSLMINAGIHHPDGIILDLEDAVAPDRKYEARFLVRNALRQLDFYGAERMVRINQVPKGLDDLEFLVPHNINLILVPKCESPDQILKVNDRIRQISDRLGIQVQIWLMPIIESALGVVKAYEIATAAENVVAMAIGLEDFTADLGTRRTVEGNESFLARCQLVLACRAAGIQAIDSVFSDVDDMEGLKQTILRSKALGYDGMGCIHPRQIRVIHENYAPDKDEIGKARKIVRAFEEAEAKGLGVVSLGSKMIDPPVVKRALKTIATAVRMGKLSQNWREEE